MPGPANVGEAMVRHVQLAIDLVNARGGVLGGTKFELVTFDSKSNPQEAQLALKQAIDQGIHYINQTNGSNIAGALVDAVNKNNERNPDQTRPVYEHRRRRSGAHQRPLQLLALPLRCGRRHEDERALAMRSLRTRRSRSSI